MTYHASSPATLMDIGAATAIITAVVAAATAYLRLFVANRLSVMREDLSKQFISRELMDGKRELIDLHIETLNIRVAKLEERMERAP